MQLSDGQCGDFLEIVGYQGAPSCYRQQLLALGLTPGTLLTIRRMAPFGDPIEIECRGARLILRKQESNILKLKKIEPCTSLD